MKPYLKRSISKKRRKNNKTIKRKNMTNNRTKKGGVKIDDKFKQELIELTATIPQKGNIRRYLQKVCSDGYCYGLAQYKGLVEDFFDGYTQFNYLDSVTELSNGSSGKVYKLNYKRDGYGSVCALKETIGRDKHF